MGKESRVERARRQREAVAQQWRDLTWTIRAETGLAVRSRAWLVGLAGLALGVELARRGSRALERAREPRSKGTTGISR